MVLSSSSKYKRNTPATVKALAVKPTPLDLLLSSGQSGSEPSGQIASF